MTVTPTAAKANSVSNSAKPATKPAAVKPAVATKAPEAKPADATPSQATSSQPTPAQVRHALETGEYPYDTKLSRRA